MKQEKTYKTQYLIYTRKSTDDADNQKNSIDYQVGECIRYATKAGLRIAKYTQEGFCQDGIIREKHTAFKTSSVKIDDYGQATFKMARPKFQDMIIALSKGQFAGIVCLCWDRISRNEQDAMLIKQLMDEGVDVRFVQTEYANSSSGKLHRDMDSMVSHHNSRVISEKVHAAYSKLRSEGKCTYRAPIGYLDYGSDNKPIDPERAPIIRRLFEQYATGRWSLTELAKWANRQGLTTKPTRKRRTGSEMLSGDENYGKKVARPVNNKTIENILTNPFYIGKLKDRGNVIDGSHTPLIESTLFHKVQKVLKSKHVSVYYEEKPFFRYRGLVRCVCKRMYSPYEQKGKAYYRSRCTRNCRNTDPNLNEPQIDETLLNFLNQVYFTDEELFEIEDDVKSKLDSASSRRNTRLDELQRQQKRIYGDLDYLKRDKITLLRNNTMTASEYTQDRSRLEQELENVKNEMTELASSEHEMLNQILTFSELVKNAALYFEHACDSEKHEIIAAAISELTFVDKELANIKAKEGFEALFARHNLNVGSEGGIRTHDLVVNSHPLCR